MEVLHEPVAVREEFCFRRNPVTDSILGRRSKMMILKSEDLPGMCTMTVKSQSKDHVDLVGTRKRKLLSAYL